MSLKRGEAYWMDAKWSVPAWLTKASRTDRATDLQIDWTLGIYGPDPRVIKTFADETATSSSVYLGNFNTGRKSYTRADFYPVTTTKLFYVTCMVRAKNEKGLSSKAPYITANFEPPRKPSIGAYSVASDGTITVTITTDAGADLKERYDTEYYWTVLNSKTGAYLKQEHGTNRGTSFNLSVDAWSYQWLVDGYIECVCRARARGYAGDSEWAERRFYLSYPTTPILKSIEAPDAINGSVIAWIDLCKSTEHPVTKVQLQALVNTEYDTVEEASGAADEWENVGGADNGSCTALAVQAAEVRPAIAGRHTWLRIYSEGPIENVLRSYSAPVEITQFYRAPYSATGDVVKILDGHAGEDGKSAVVLLGWAPDGATDESTGTELSWSNEQDTWRSTDEPDTFNVLYDDGPITYDSVSYGHSATITIKGLSEGETTYIKARRYHEAEDATTYGEYSETYMVTPAVIPASVVLNAPAYVAEGRDFSLTWTYDSDAVQDAWAVMDSNGAVVSQAQNSLGTCTIEAERAAGLAVDGAITLSVMVSMGGAWVTSESRTVTIVEAPTLTASTAATLTAQPMSITAECDSATAQLAITVTSNGVSGDTPSGMEVQVAGDVVWSGVVDPIWTNGAATVTLPNALAFADGATYSATVKATDPGTGLSSDVVELSTVVAWSHQAPDPDGCATLTPIDTVDEYGISTKAVRIALVPPTGSVASDCYDVYRMTGDGAQLIGQTYPLTVMTVDDYAPYGSGMELAYRIACRTADGDVQWADVAYELDGDMLRIDWAEQYVELPYDITIDDGYEKSADVHEYLDGSTDAFFNPGVRRSEKLATNVMRLIDADTIAAVMQLANYVGTAYVRTPTGKAYQAVVSVDSIAPTKELAAVSISTTEVRLTSAYQLPPFNVVDEIGDGE